MENRPLHITVTNIGFATFRRGSVHLRRASHGSHTRACCCQQRLQLWLLLLWPTRTRSVVDETMGYSLESRWSITFNAPSSSCCCGGRRAGQRPSRSSAPRAVSTGWTLYYICGVACMLPEQLFTSPWLSFHMSARCSTVPWTRPCAAMAFKRLAASIFANL